MSTHSDAEPKARATSTLTNALRAVMGILYERIDAVPHTRRDENNIDDRDGEAKSRIIKFLNSLTDSRPERANIRRAVRLWRKEALQSAIDAAEQELEGEAVQEVINYWSDELTVDNSSKIAELQAEISSKTNELIEAKIALETSERRLEDAMKKGKPTQMSAHRRAAIELWKMSTGKLEEFAQMLEGIQLDINEATAKSEEALHSARTLAGPGNRLEALRDKSFLKFEKIKRTLQEQREEYQKEIQHFFDHQAQGASQSETTKKSRTGLKIPDDPVAKKLGFKLIQQADLFFQGASNEYWAIMADIIRIGHDCDPDECLHWKPPPANDLTVPPSLRKYRIEQARAFAIYLNQVCQGIPGLSARLRSTQVFGVKKNKYTADDQDGIAMWWTLISLTHPLSRDYRVRLQSDIYSAAASFKSGDPEAKLASLAVKVQEGIEVELKISWEAAGIPIIEALASRHSTLAIRLDPYREMPDDRDDSIMFLGQLLAEADDQVKSTKAADSDAFKAPKALLSRKEEKAVKKASAAKKKAKQSRKSKSARQSNATKRTCKVRGCQEKIDGNNPRWKLCATHEKAHREGETLIMKDGDEWPPARVEKRPRESAKKAKKAKSNKRSKIAEPEGDESSESEEDEYDEEEPPRKKSSAARKRAKLEDPGVKRTTTSVSRARQALITRKALKAE